MPGQPQTRRRAELRDLATHSLLGRKALRVATEIAQATQARQMEMVRLCWEKLLRGVTSRNGIRSAMAW
jgi:hypothetical protein